MPSILVGMDQKVSYAVTQRPRSSPTSAVARRAAPMEIWTSHEHLVSGFAVRCMTSGRFSARSDSGCMYMRQSWSSLRALCIWLLVVRCLRCLRVFWILGDDFWKCFSFCQAALLFCLHIFHVNVDPRIRFCILLCAWFDSGHSS